MNMHKTMLVVILYIGSMTNLHAMNKRHSDEKNSNKKQVKIKHKPSYQDAEIDALSESTKRLIFLLPWKNKILSDASYKNDIRSIEQENDFKNRMNLYNALIYNITKKEFEENKEGILRLMGERVKEGKARVRDDKGIAKSARNEVLLCKYLNIAYHIHKYQHDTLKTESRSPEDLEKILKSMNSYLKIEEGVYFFSDTDAKKIIKKYSKAVHKKIKHDASTTTLLSKFDWYSNKVYVSPADFMDFKHVQEFMYQNEAS